MSFKLGVPWGFRGGSVGVPWGFRPPTAELCSIYFVGSVVRLDCLSV